jgi:hypothetical protein
VFAVVLRVGRWAATWAIKDCDPTARDLALRFSPEVRMFVYAALMADATGRVEQMVESCPGLLTRAATDEGFGARALAGICEGLPLRGLLVDAVASVMPVERRPAAAVFVRRVPASVPPGVLTSTLMALGSDVNDMPSSVDERHTWYEWQAEGLRVQRRFADADRPRFGSFVSKHALALDAIAIHGLEDRAILLSEIVDWARSDQGTVPTRAASPQQIYDTLHYWHYEMWTRINIDVAGVLAEAPVAFEEIDGVFIEPIRTVGELFDEGTRMRHCVATHAQDALKGRIHVYRGTVRGERVTIAIERADDSERWRLVEASGFANRRTTKLGVIQRWIEMLEPSSVVRPGLGG